MPWILDPERLRSRSKNTPFDGARFEGRVLRTLVAGRTVYEYPILGDQPTRSTVSQGCGADKDRGGDTRTVVCVRAGEPSNGIFSSD